MKYLFILSVCIFITSCRITNTQETVILPESLQYTSSPIARNDTIHTILNKAHFKIITRIDGDCPKCYPQLELWDKYIRELREKRTPVSFHVVINVTNKLVFEYATEKYHYNYCFSLDVENKFNEQNQELLKTYEGTFLTNNKNEIIYSGNPILNINHKLKYFEIFETHKILNKKN